jgi:peroxiredoxin (alkyl hydroperoxide reductase subunit C)
MKKRYVLTVCAVIMLTVAGISSGRADSLSGDRKAPIMASQGKAALNSSVVKSEKQAVMVGMPAPDFKLEGVIGTEPGKEFKSLQLKDFKDKWLVLFFYPADFTFVCPTEIKGFSDNIESFSALNAEVVAVSTDSKWSHLAWIKRGDLGHLRYPLLADFNKETARAYGVLDAEQGVALRGLFIIDPNGVLQYQVIHNLDVGRSIEETLRVLEALQSGGLCPLGWKPGQKTLSK